MAITEPYGSIFSFKTPYLDKASDRLYAEQRQREQMRQQQQRVLDDEFAKNMANVKDIDVPEIAKKYGDWKLHYQQLQKNGSVSPEQQLENLRKKADIYRAINESKAQKERDENDRKLLGTHPENLVDEANDVLLQRYKTPTSQLGSVMFKNPLGQDVALGNYNILYNGTNYNSAEDATKAKGQLLTNEVPNGDNLDTYQFHGNTPQQVKDYYLGVMGKREANKFYRNRLMNLPADELTKTEALYNSIPDSQFQLMGQKKPKLEFSDLNNQADTYATYEAMKAAVENVPRMTKTALSDAAKMRMQTAKEKDVISFREGLAQANRKEMLDLREKAKSLGEKTADVWIDNYIDKLSEEASQEGKPRLEYTSGTSGQKTTAPIIEVDPTLSKALEKQKVQPSEIMVLPDGKFKPIYYKYDSNNERVKGSDGAFKVDMDLSRPITREQLKLALGGKTVSPTQRTKEMLNQQSATPKKQYSYNGKSYSSEQIEKAAKQNNMTIDEYIKKAGIK